MFLSAGAVGFPDSYLIHTVHVAWVVLFLALVTEEGKLGL